MHFLEGLVLGAPVWVWPLLAVLMWLGLRATRDRSAPVWLTYLMPLITLSAIPRIISLVETTPGLAGYVAGMVAGIAFGYWRQGAWIVGKSAGMLQMRGEWFTLVAVMIIFWSNFVNGTVQAINPELPDHPAYALTLAVVLALAGGFFLGRTIRTIVTPGTAGA